MRTDNNRILRNLIKSQQLLSRAFDRILDDKYRLDGNRDFVNSFAPLYLKPNLRIYDIGGGKNPYIDLKLKSTLRLSVVGLDIDQGELDRAPKGAYDELICCDITKYEGKQDADLIICQAVLEHVENVDEAFAALSSILRPGGKAIIFVPSKNAAFARLNLLLPQRMKKKILYTIFPQTQSNQGFRSYYDRCTPRDFDRLSEAYGFEIEEKRVYFVSSYLSFLFPAYLMWRLWILLFHLLAGDQSAETFSVALRKRSIGADDVLGLDVPYE